MHNYDDNYDGREEGGHLTNCAWQEPTNKKTMDEVSFGRIIDKVKKGEYDSSDDESEYEYVNSGSDEVSLNFDIDITSDEDEEEEEEEEEKKKDNDNESDKEEETTPARSEEDEKKIEKLREHMTEIMTSIGEFFEALDELSLHYDRYKSATNSMLRTAAKKEVNAKDLNGGK